MGSFASDTYCRKNADSKRPFLHLKQSLLVSSLILILSLGWNVGMGQVNISSGTTITQNFNGLGTTAITNWTNNVTLPGWYTTNTVTAGVATLPIQTGSTNINNCYNAGILGTNPITDRALGALSTSNTHRFGLRLYNNGTSTINSFNISFTGEQWRAFNSGTLVFEYQKGTTVTSLTTGTWTAFTSLDFTSLSTSVSPGTATDGNNTSFRTPKNATLTVDVPVNTEIFFRWTKAGTSSACLAIDDLSITASTSSYSVIFNANGGTGSMSNQTIAPSGSAALSTNTFTNLGYTFAGWNTAANGTSGTNYSDGATFAIGTSNTTLYAQWIPNNHTITFNATTGTGTMSNQTIATAASATLNSNTFTNTGYNFSGWYTNATGTGGTFYSNGAPFTMGVTDTILYAQWISLSAYNCPSYNTITPSTLTICQGVKTQLTTTVYNNGGIVGTAPTNLYQWYFNTTPSTSISTATSILDSTAVTFTPPSTGSGIRYYFCVGYATGNSCNQTSTSQGLVSSAAVMVTVNPTPATPTAGSTGSCSGTALSLTATAINSATYSWTGPNSFSSNNQTPQVSAAATTLMTGNYTVTATLNGCVSAIGTTYVTVNTTPAAPTGAAQTFCNGTLTTNSIVTSPAATNWYSAATGVNLLAAGATISNGQNYYATQITNGCESPRSLGINVTILNTFNPGTTTVTNHLVISQVYGGGGNTGAQYTNDFIEIFNPTPSAVTLTGWSVQYASSTGTSWTAQALSGSIGAGKYYLIKLAAGTTVSGAITADATGTIPMSATDGKVALVNTTTALTGANPLPASYIDLVGYGLGTNGFEGSPTLSISNTTALFRNSNGCTDNNQNNSDFYIAAPNPRNSSTPMNFCGSSLQTICAGSAPLPMTVFGSYGSGSFTYQWYYQTGSVTAPTGISAVVAGWTSLGSAQGAQTSVYTPTTPINAQTSYAVFVTASGTPTCNAGAGQWATGAIVVSVNAVPAAPTTTTFQQYFCSNSNPAIENISVTGSSISWYSAATGGTPLAPGTLLTTGGTTNSYFATQTVNGCSSPIRLEVQTTVYASPASPFGTSPQSFCGGTHTISELTPSITGPSILWYTAATSGTILTGTDPVVTGTHYYATQSTTYPGKVCESNVLDVLVVINGFNGDGIVPIGAQTIPISTNGIPVTVNEVVAPTSRVWMYSTNSGGPYTNNTGITASSYIPNFPTPGTYYVVCQSTFSLGCTITSGELVITVNNTAPNNPVLGATCTGAVVFSVGNTKADINWAASIGTVVPDGYAVFVTAGATAPVGPLLNSNTYIANSNYSLASTATPASLGKCVYIGTGLSTSVTSFTSGSTYSFKVYAFKGSTYTGWSTGSGGSTKANVVLAVPNVSGLANTSGNASSVASWTNPSNTSPYCWDEILVVANAGPVVFTPTGDGTAYTANSFYTTSNQVVYKGTGNFETITGLTNGIQYCFKVFVRKGTEWSTGVSNCVIPYSQIPVPDAGCQAANFATSVFNFPTNLVITKVTVGVKITTTYRGDLILRLVSPSGTEIVLQNAVGSFAYNLDALYDDAGTGSAATVDHVIDAVYDITCPAQGSPTQPLSSFNGEFSQGNWTLKVCDEAAPDLAYINDFKVFITGTPACVSTVNITSFAPQLGPVGTVVTFIGSGFTGATAVKFGSLNASTYTVVNDNTITAKLPPNATTSLISIVDASGCAKKTSSVFTIISSAGSCGNGLSGTGTDLFVSEVYDGTTGDDQYVEIFNPTLSTIPLNGYSLRITATGNTGSNTTNIAFTSGATIASGAVYTLRIGNSATTPCTPTVNQANGAGGFNGNDEVFLLKASSIIDYVPNPTTLSGAGFSQQRNATVTGPSATYNAAEWTVTGTESCSYLGTGPYPAGPLITVTTQPQDVNCSSISFTAAATTSIGTTSYLWKYFNPATGTWVNASAIPDVTTSNTNTATMTITGSTAQLINYQFYCVITSGGCNVASNAAQYSYSSKPYYRCKATGNWSDANTWEMSTSPTNWVAATAACSYPTKENSSAVFIETPYTVTQDININIDYLEIKNGATLKTSTLSQLTVSDSTIGADFIVNGIWEYNSGSSNSFGFDVATGTWQLGANAAIIKTNSGSASILRDNYETGMINIPATANWIIRYLGADVNFTTTGGTYYPNLIFESNSGLWSPLASATASRFTGNTGFATVKGNFDIGGTGTGKVTVFNENTNAQPMLIYGNLQIRNGDSLTNIGTANGTGFEIKGNLVVDGLGVLTANGGSGVIKLTGAAAQSVSGTGVINLRKLLVTNSAPVGQNVTFSKDISVPDTLQITQGFVDAGTTTLNGTAKLVMSDGSLQLSKNATVLPELTGAYVLTGGTVIFNGNGTGANAQTIRPVKYYNITSLNTGDRIMSPTDTVGIANVFTKGTNSYNFTGSTVNYNGLGNQTIASFIASNVTTGKTYNNLVLSKSGIKTAGGKVDVEDALCLKENVTLALDAFDIALKSTQYKTSHVCFIPSTAAITYTPTGGRFIVERFIPTGTGPGQHPKSWQMLATPTTETDLLSRQTIRQAWQEGASLPNQNLIPGYGTQITSNLGGNRDGAVSLGFDVYTAPGPSMKTYNYTTGLWAGIPNTINTPIYNPKGYMVFVRGNRNDTAYNQLPEPTNLRTRGKIFSPSNKPDTTTILAGKFESIGNPYASAIDFVKLTLETICDLSIENTFYVWDPLLTGTGTLGLGGYQTLSGNNQDFTVSPGGTTNFPTGSRCTTIQSGQAFFMHAPAGANVLVPFSENFKVDSNKTSFRTTNSLNTGRQYLRTFLYSGTGESAVIVDGVVVAFAANFSNKYDYNDALKMTNSGENLGIVCKDKILALEARSIVMRTDTVFLTFSNLRRQTYEFRFAPKSLPLTGLDIRLIDRFLGTSLPISSGDSTFVSFALTADPASYSASRFIIVFKKLNPTLPTHTTVLVAETAKAAVSENTTPSIKESSIDIYPNPITDHIAHIRFVNQPIGNYTARILSANGQVITEKKITLKTGCEEKSIQLKGLSSAAYQLQLVGKDGHKFSKQIIVQ